jgi:hypothetical protein
VPWKGLWAGLKTTGEDSGKISYNKKLIVNRVIIQ